MQTSTRKKRNEHFSIVYRYFEDLEATLKLTTARSVAAIIIRTASDGGDVGWQPSNVPCLTVDLDTVSGFECAMSAIENRIFDTVIFSSDSERDLHSVQMSPGEVRFSQEVMWRRLGAKGRIVAYPLYRRILPKPDVRASVAALSPEEFDIRFKALIKDDA